MVEAKIGSNPFRYAEGLNGYTLDIQSTFKIKDPTRDQKVLVESLLVSPDTLFEVLLRNKKSENPLDERILRQIANEAQQRL